MYIYATNADFQIYNRMCTHERLVIARDAKNPGILKQGKKPGNLGEKNWEIWEHWEFCGEKTNSR